VGKHRPDYTN